LPVRWIIRRNQAVVTGVPASVTNTYGDPCWTGRKARSSGPCNGWTLSIPPLARLTCNRPFLRSICAQRRVQSSCALIHACRPGGSPQHPLPHSFPFASQLRSGDQLQSQSDIPVLDKLSWAIGEVVFDLLWLGLCQSWLSWPCVMGIGDGRVFGIQQQSEHWSAAQDGLGLCDQLRQVRL
jgi:hypothetical protein